MISVSDEMAKKIEYYADKMGVPQSALCAQFVGQAIMGYDKAYEMVNTIGKNMENKILESQLKGQIDISEILEIGITDKLKKGK